MSLPHRLCLVELVALAVAGVVHVALEMVGSAAAARTWNVVACIAFLGYVGWRVMRSRAVLLEWGLRLDNLRSAVLAQGGFVVVAMLAVLAHAGVRGGEPNFDSRMLPLYLLWGIAQQFALQNLLVRNLTALIRPPVAAVLLAAALFGAVHLPRVELAMFASVGGAFLTWIHQRFPNLIATGLAHGILGALVFSFLVDGH